MQSESNRFARSFIAASLFFVAPVLFAQNRLPVTVGSGVTASPTVAIATDSSTNAVNPNARCHWWQFGRCDQQHDAIEGFPDGAPRTGVVVTVDISSNQLYLFRDAQLVEKSPAATGTGKLLKHGRKIWMFHTPEGHLKVLRKVVDPVWTKPDWAFVEDRADPAARLAQAQDQGSPRQVRARPRRRHHDPWHAGS